MLNRSLPRFNPSSLLLGFLPPAPSSTACVPPSAATRLSLFERLDRWLWRQEQKNRERYLAGAQDRFDLERRMREIERRGTFGLV